MSGDAIAIVSVASGAAVAVAVPAINARLERSKLQFQAQAIRLDELRARLDEGVTALSESEGALERAEARVEAAQRSTAPVSARGAAIEAMEKLRETNDQVGQAQQLMAVRLGSRSDVVRAYHDARQDLHNLESELQNILESGPASDSPEQYAEAIESMAQLNDAYGKHKAAFLDAASDVVGLWVSDNTSMTGRRPVWLMSGLVRDGAKHR